MDTVFILKSIYSRNTLNAIIEFISHANCILLCFGNYKHKFNSNKRQLQQDNKL